MGHARHAGLESNVQGGKGTAAEGDQETSFEIGVGLGG